ncbi:hypothetical protein RJT34_07503 [Clitoria ternatea]|uniref:Uncharacterized protein n=1 Tax=Clitoria ternatea TaxID=43366 RepID=A0AAN9PU20_CLITE
MALMPCQISILNKEKYSSNTLQIIYGVHTARASNAAKAHNSAHARYPAKECNSVQACYSAEECNLAKVVTPPSHRLNIGGMPNFPYCVASPYHPQSGQGNIDPVRRTVTPPQSTLHSASLVGPFYLSFWPFWPIIAVPVENGLVLKARLIYRIVWEVVSLMCIQEL